MHNLLIRAIARNYVAMCGSYLDQHKLGGFTSMQLLKSIDHQNTKSKLAYEIVSIFLYTIKVNKLKLKEFKKGVWITIKV